MKKTLILILTSLILIQPCIAKTDKTSKEYLKNKKHFAIMNPVAEKAAEKVIKKSLQKEIGKGKYKIKFEGYTLGSMRKGIFKTLEIEGKNIEIDTIPVKHLKLKNITDYNWIDFNESPTKIKSDIDFAYEIELTEESINKALNHNEYQKIVDKINKLAHPLFSLHDVEIKIRNNKTYIIMTYSLPLASSKKERKFIASSDFKVYDGKIKASNVHIDKAYGNISLDKVTNLINLIDPLSFTLKEINERDCKGRIENVKIDNDVIYVNGKIFIKGE